MGNTFAPKADIDLSEYNSASITGQNRRSTLKYIDGKANRNFVSSMQNILSWGEEKPQAIERKQTNDLDVIPERQGKNKLKRLKDELKD